MTRAATPARWKSALARGFATGIVPRRFGSSGWFLVPSATRKGVSYLTDGRQCSCEAAKAGDPCCWHRAVVWPALMATMVGELDRLGWDASPEMILKAVTAYGWLEAHGIGRPAVALPHSDEPQTAA